MKINPFDLGRLAMSFLDDFIKKLIILIDKEGADKLKISSQYNNLLLPAADKFDKAYQKSRKGTFTDKISGLDKSRDDTTIAILGIINVMLKSGDPKKVAAAKIVKKVFDEFKGIIRKARSEQSSKTTNLLQMIRGKYAEEATELGLDEWLDKLEALNEEIIAAEIERVEEKAEKGKFDATESKKAIISAYRIMCMQLESSIATDGAANYENFIRNLNALIGEFGGTGKTKPSDDETSGDDEEKYPDAKEWIEDLPFMGVENGDIYYILVDGKKVFYKIIDKQKFFWHPESEKAAGGWEKLN